MPEGAGYVLTEWRDMRRDMLAVSQTEGGREGGREGGSMKV